MRELIDKKKARELTFKDTGYYDPINVASQIREWIDNLPTVAEPHWIPVSERLPEMGDYVLLCFREGRDCPYNRIKIGKLGSHEVEDKNFIKIGVKTVWYTDQWYCDFDKVIAWMPLPESYKEEQNE